MLVLVLVAVLRVAASHAGEQAVPGPLDPRGFQFMRVDPGTGDPVAYNACQPVHYVINPAGAPEGVVDNVHEAFEITSRATGINFVFDGPTDEVGSMERSSYQPDRYGEKWAPILISWVTGPPTGSDSANAIGLGGSAYEFNDSGKPVFVSGSATFDASVPLQPGFGGETWGQVILHELGHVVGLDHVRDDRSVMNPVLGLRPASWGEGDRAGLWSLGVGGKCLATPPVP